MKSQKLIFLLLLACIPISGLFSQIHDIKVFLEQCPTNDPLIDTILKDFEFRVDDEVITEFPCTEPVSSMPVENYTQPLIYLQTMRVAYYMDTHRTHYLPWTNTNLYDWLKKNLDGIKVSTNFSSGGYCCDVHDGKVFMVLGSPDEFNREFDKKWRGISGNLDFVAHEARHNDGNYPHCNCCASTACDSIYDESDLGCYGVQYWLNKAWVSGFINVGIKTSNTPAEIDEIIMQHLNAMNYQYRDRFCVNIPPMVKLDQFGNLVETSVETPENSDVSLYPVPSENTIYIRYQPGLSQAEISISDLSGRLIRSYGNINLAPEGDYPVDISALATGQYLIRVKFPDKTLNLKFVKE